MNCKWRVVSFSILVFISILLIGFMEDDCYFMIRLMQNSSDNLGAFYIILAFLLGYAVKEGCGGELYLPFAGMLGVFISTTLAGGADVKDELTLGALIITIVFGMVFIMSFSLVVMFMYSFISSNPKEKLVDSSQSVSNNDER